MNSFKQTVAAALKDVRIEAVQLGASIGFDRRAPQRAASAELDRWEKAHSDDCGYPRGRARAALALSRILDPAFIYEPESVKEIDHELAVLKRFAESKRSAGRRIAA
jgi:hypothetical protein